MADVSPYMALTLPTVSETLGPTWASQLNTALGKVDSHDHSPGKGKFITPLGMNIDADLPFGSQNATGLRSIRLVPQASAIALATDVACLYSSPVSTGDLYYNDGAGNHIRITVGGAIDTSTSGSISGMGATTASVAYSSSTKTFTFDQNTNERALLDIGPLTIREDNGAATNGVSLTAPAGLAADYGIVFPSALPGSTQWMTLASSGAISFTSADAIAAGMTSTGANNIASTMSVTGVNSIATTATSTAANLYADKRTRATGSTVAAGGVAISSSSGSFSTTSDTLVLATNMDVTITTTGRPVQIMLVPIDGALSFVSVTGTRGANLYIYNNAGVVSYASALFSDDYPTPSSGAQTIIPPGAVSAIDTPAAGTVRYRLFVQVAAAGVNNTVGIRNCRLIAYEL